jgi:hypothetical protein
MRVTSAFSDAVLLRPVSGVRWASHTGPAAHDVPTIVTFTTNNVDIAQYYRNMLQQTVTDKVQAFYDR